MCSEIQPLLSCLDLLSEFFPKLAPRSDIYPHDKRAAASAAAKEEKDKERRKERREGESKRYLENVFIRPLPPAVQSVHITRQRPCSQERERERDFITGATLYEFVLCRCAVHMRTRVPK